ncbi:hypothetical protein EAO70_32795 [Streptomyces sp. adm13(2018)]|nr:hypothetical protein EAO70_32795 [Streptomyces sp. adm13(2018)]
MDTEAQHTERDPSSVPEEGSRSVCCASVSIAGRAYPDCLCAGSEASSVPGAEAQRSRFSLILAALPRSSRR